MSDQPLPTQSAADPIGSLVDAVTDTILEFVPRNGRRRLTNDEGVAEQLAREIVEFFWAWDGEEILIEDEGDD